MIHTPKSTATVARLCSGPVRTHGVMAGKACSSIHGRFASAACGIIRARLCGLIFALSLFTIQTANAQTNNNAVGNYDYSVSNGRMTIEQLPADRGWTYGESPADRFLKQVVKSTWVRLEYMQFSFEPPGVVILGSDVRGVPDPTQLFPVFSAPGAATPFGFATVPDLGPINFRSINGVRGTIGLPVSVGTFEASIFSFQEARDNINRTPELGLPFDPADTPNGLPIFVGNSTFTNGQIAIGTGATNIFLYDEAYTATMTSEIWGYEFDFVWDTSGPGEGFKIQPIFGFRHIDTQEKVSQVGTFNGLDLLPDLVSTIDAQTENKIYAPQLGLRMSLVHRWFTIGMDAKVGFGINSYESFTDVNNLRAEGDPRVLTNDSETVFSPIGDFRVYGKFKVTQYFSLSVGYNILVMAKITRPQHNIFYNDNGIGLNAGLVQQTAFQNIHYQGLTLGGEFRWR